MTFLHHSTTGPPPAEDVVAAPVSIPQLSPKAVMAVWVAATVPMGLAAWVIAPALASRFAANGLAKALLLTLTAGLIWQFVLVAVLVRIEQGPLRWSTIRSALWLHPPRNPTSARRGGRLWWVLLPLTLVFVLQEAIPVVPHPEDHNFGTILSTDAGQAMFSGAWGWYAVALTLFVFNTVLGEELLYRGYLLPRMEGTFGRWAWLANGVLFAFSHLHVWWVIPSVLIVDTVVLSWASQRYRSALIGIAVHSSQSVFLAIALLGLVLS